MRHSQNTEDYLETIYILKKERRDVRVKDIASNLGVSPPSVTQMIRKLAAKDLVNYERYGTVRLTPKGTAVARRTYAKHTLLVEFFVSLGIDERTALRDACLAEHVLSRKTLDRLKRLTPVAQRRSRLQPRERAY